VDGFCVWLSVYGEYLSPATLQEFKLREHVRFVPAEPVADAFFGVVVPTACEKPFDDGFFGELYRDYLEIFVPAKKLDHVVETHSLFPAACETVRDDVFFAREVVDYLFGLEIYRHEIRHAMALVYDRTGEFTGKSPRVAERTEFSTHIDANDATVAFGFVVVYVHLHLRAFASTLRAEK
jgi:hypothetical protein